MSTQAQVLANQANSQRSTGPKTEEDKAASSHERAFHRCLNDLLKLRADKRKAELALNLFASLAVNNLR